MSLTCKVGGARETFEPGLGREVAGVLDNAFGAENEWEGTGPRAFGDLIGSSWADFQTRAVEELGKNELPNLLAMNAEGGGVYLPAHVQPVSLPLSAGKGLRCASLPGLRRELVALAERWDLPQEDEALRDILRVAQDSVDGPVADLPEVLTFARLMLAANEAVRRDCPLWLVGDAGEE
ncbi:MAG TPA: hypothetical protein VFT74_16775 [Isosphaeraceae bacterium]|nr:hypothetical protein [Isosphaeraceae bacterium]